MLRPREMTKVTLVSTQSMLRRVVEELYGMELLHIDEFEKAGGFFDIGKPFAEASEHSDQLVKLRSMISYFNLTGEPSKLKNIRAAKKKFTPIHKRFTSLVEKIGNSKSEESRLQELMNNPILRLNIPKSHQSLKSVVSFVGTVKKKFLEEQGDYEILKYDMVDTVAIALFTAKKNAEKVKKLLDKHGFVQYPIPQESYKKVKTGLQNVQKKLVQATAELEKIKRSSQFLLDYEYMLSQLVEKGEAPLKFASSSNTFIARGWIPTGKKAEFETQLNRITDRKVALYYDSAGHDAPVALDNPKLAKPFEFFLSLFALPVYGEIDPTLIFLIAFPIFFGFMLGDVGYGAAVLALTFLVAKMFPKGMKPLFNIVRVAAIWSVVFGFVFGEFFGYDFITNPLLNRIRDINTMILLAIAIGVVHINLGLAFGFVNELRFHGIKKAILTKGGWYVLETGIALIVASILFLKSQMFEYAGLATATLGAIMLFRGEGIKGLVELPTIFSNTLSYIRLFAIGLSSAAFALIINNSAIGLIHEGSLMIAAAIAILTIGHFINLLLGILGSFLQALRLHYVEFFLKFFEGGGNKYMPFGIKNGGR